MTKLKQQQQQLQQEETGSTSDMKDIKKQLNELMAIVPIVTEMKTAYDKERERQRLEDMEEEEDQEDTSEELENVNVMETEKKIREEGELEESDEEVLAFKDKAGVAKKIVSKMNKSLAEGVEHILCEGLDTKTKEETSQKYAVPENCQRLHPVKVNPEIYKPASKRVRINDNELQNIQKDLGIGLAANISVFEDLMKASKNITDLINTGKDELNKEDLSPKEKRLLENLQEERKSFLDSLKKIKTTTADAVSLQSDVNHQIDIFRRVSFKPEIKPEFISLCSDSYPVKDSLFGKELSERVKETTEAAKISNRVSKAPLKKKPFKKNRGAEPFSFFGGGSSSNHWKQRSQNKEQKFNPQHKFVKYNHNQNQRYQQNQKFQKKAYNQTRK